MFERDYAGSILLNGSPRKIDVSGNAMTNRTTIRLDGVTVYNKISLFGNRPIEFVPFPGRKAVLRWEQGAVTFECDITADGKTSRLARLGGSVKPTNPENQIRIGGAACLLFGILSLVLNYYDLKKGQYWTSLGTEPFFILVGLAGFGFPRTMWNWNQKWNSKLETSKPIWLIVIVLFLTSAWFMKSWLMAWMLQH
jgi:hypothetical protein